MKCVILAARRAPRLSPHTDGIPAALLPVGGRPILHRALTSFTQLGVEEIAIVTGYQGHRVRDAVAEWFPGLSVTFVDDPDHASANDARSLLLAREHVEGHAFALLGGDLVFDLSVVKQLMVLGLDVMAVRHGRVKRGEVKVTLDTSGYVLEIGEHVPVTVARGRAIGISLFSARTSRRLFAALHACVHDRRLVDEPCAAALQQIIAEGVALRGVDIGHRHAASIDTSGDLLEAELHLSGMPRFDVRSAPLRAW